MDITPKSVLSKIKELEHLGFNDDHFQFIHHWGNLKGKDSSLESHKAYLKSVRSYQVASNNFKIAEKLAKCLTLAKSVEGDINFADICNQVNGILQNKQHSNRSRLNPERGLYVVTLNNQHPISANADDKRIAHIAIKVNRENCKFGKAVNLSNRRKNYYKTFGEENVNFQPVVLLSEIDIAEKEVLRRLKQFRQVSPSGNLTEWLHGINSGQIIEVINEALVGLGFQHDNFLAKEKDGKR